MNRKNRVFFFDPIIIFVTALVLLILFLSFYPSKSLFSWPNKETLLYSIERSSTISSVFIGFIVAATVLSFQVFNKYFGRFAFYQFFENKWLIRLFSLFVVNVLVAYYALSYLKQNPIDNYGRSLAFLSTSISLVLIAFIFPIAIKIINQSQSRKNIEKLFLGLNTERLLIYLDQTQGDNKRIEEIESDPINIANEIATYSIKENDSSSFYILIDTFQTRALSLIQEINRASYNEILYSRFMDFGRDLFQLATKDSREQLSNKVVRSIFEFDRHFILNSSTIANHSGNVKYDPILFEVRIKESFHRSAQAKQIDVSERIIDNYRDRLTNIVDNYLSKVFVNYDMNDYTSCYQEKMLFLESLKVINQFAEDLINNKTFDSFKNIFNTYTTLELNLMDQKLELEAKNWMLHAICQCKKEVFLRYVNATTEPIRMLYFPFFSLSMQGEIDKLGKIRLFNCFLGIIQPLYKRERLNNMAIGSMMVAGCHFLNKIQEGKNLVKPFTLLIQKFDQIRSYIEANTESDYQKDVYIKLYNNLVHINSDFVQRQIANAEIKNLLDTSVQRFALAERFAKELKDSGYVPDNNIV